MAFIGDTTPIKLQLKLTNYAEALEKNKLRHHVRRISFIITILDDECGSADEMEYHAYNLSAEDQVLLNWQASTENLQDDVEVRNELTAMSGKLCPYKKISLSLFDKVTDNDTYQQRMEPHQLSAYRHVTFRSAMLTKHSASDGQVQLLFLSDGLPENRSCLRWRSHDYIKLNLPDARVSYRVFWLVQWDVVDFSVRNSDALVGTSRDIVNWRPSCSDHPLLERQGDSTQKFHGIRHSGKRKSPWIAEVRPKGWRGRDKIWLGSYKTAAAAARAVDAGYHYYNLPNSFNFPDSPSLLQKQIPGGLDPEGVEVFVKMEAHRLGGLAERVEMPPPAWIPDNRSPNSSTEGFSSTSSQPWNIGSGNNFWQCSMQAAATNANFAGLAKGFLTPSLDSRSYLKAANLDMRPSTSYGSDASREIVGSSPEEHLGQSTSNNTLTGWTQANAEPLERGYINEAPFTSVRNGEPMNDVLDDFYRYSEQISNDIAGDTPTEIASAGVSNANDLRQQTFPGFDFGSLPDAEPQQAEPIEDYARLWLQYSPDSDL